MKNLKGYSLIELLITIVIMLIVLSAVYLTYISLLKGYKKESMVGSKIIEEQIALELIRKDITLAGLGIADNVSPVDISGSDDNKILTLYSTQSPSSDKTQGYLLLKFDNSTNRWILVDNNSDRRIDKTNNNIIVIDTNRKRWVKGVLTSGYIDQTSPYPSSNQLAFGYPLTSLTSDYESIVYRIGGTPPPRCNPYTKNLLRSDQSIINCVKGFKIYFGADVNNDGTIDGYYDKLAVPAFDNISKIYNNLQSISIFILTHDGGKDNNFNFNNSSINLYDNEIGANVSFSLIGIPEYNRYRWKILKVSAKTVNIRGVAFSD